MIRKIGFLVLLTTLAACASKLDASATASNAANVRSLVGTIDKLHVKFGSPDSLRQADAEIGVSFIRQADAMVEAAKAASK